jgi:hypothetical protein
VPQRVAMLLSVMLHLHISPVAAGKWRGCELMICGTAEPKNTEVGDAGGKRVACGASALVALSIDFGLSL